MIEAQAVEAVGNIGTNPLGFLAALRPESVTLRKAMTGWALGMAGWQGVQKGRNWWRSRYQYSVSVKQTEDIYDDVVQRLTAMIPERNKRALLAAAMRDGRRLHRSRFDEVSPNGYTPKTRLATFYDGGTAQTFTIDGHKVQVAVEKESINYDDRTGGDHYYKNEKLRFITHTEDGRAAVIRWLESIVGDRDEVDVPRFFILSRWGGSWDRRNDLPARTLDSVILRAGQAEDLAADIATWLSQRDEYLARGWPYHRGYLLYGPPGTGKTSLAQALAGHFGLDLYYAPLADMAKDTNLLHLVSQVPANSVLLLEDVDVFHAATQRNDAAEGVSLSGLLNALDGVSTPSGIITIMTTNDRSVLDPALVRPGRVDQQVEVGYVDDEQLHRLVDQIVGEPVSLPSIGNGTMITVTPAEVIETMKPYLHEPKLGVDPLRKMLDKRKAQR